MSFETVQVRTDGPVAMVTLDRPSAGNSVNQRMAFEIREVCDRLAGDDGVRVVVITGRGRDFCLGTDLDLPSADGAAQVGYLALLRVAPSIAAVDKPVIAAVNGDALDQGLEIALACDIRVASTQTKLGLTQAGKGLMSWDGGTQRLPRLIGRGRAMEMILTSRIVDAEEALDIGLLNQITGAEEVLEKAHRMADTIAGLGPIATRYLKEAVLKGLDLTLDQGLRVEADLTVMLQSTLDRAEGIRSFIERRRPRYRGE